MAKTTNNHFKMSKTLKRILSLSASRNTPVSADVKQMLITAEVHAETWRRYGNKDKSNSNEE